MDFFERRVEAVDQTQHQHEWVVFSTALTEGWLMLQCVECGTHGTIDDPTSEEWSEGFDAPSKPYRWQDESRITIRHPKGGERYVVRAEPRQPCDCLKLTSLIEYDRFPAEIVRRIGPISDEARNEILELAEFVDSEPEMCGRRFPFFVASYAEYTGKQFAEPTLSIVDRIRVYDVGLHMAAPVVARALRVFANYVDLRRGCRPQTRQ